MNGNHLYHETRSNADFSVPFRVIGFHKAADILGKILIEPVADSDAAFAEVTGVIRAEKILEVLTAPPCIHCEWVHSAGARPMCIDAAMISV